MMPLKQINACVWQILLLFTICTMKCSLSAHQPVGFISIDCGSSHQYNDNKTGLTWETDDNYIPTGQNGNISEYDLSTLLSSDDNYEALQTFRFFPEPQAKYCYQLNISRGNILVLARAMFFLPNSSQLVLPITFNIFINNTLWSSIQYDDRYGTEPTSKEGYDDRYGRPDVTQVIESIFYSPGNIAFICLVPNQGTPFISSLELRQLDPEGSMYSFKDREKVLLTTIARVNVGAPSAATVRFPEDAYDRLWRYLGGIGTFFPCYVGSLRTGNYTCLSSRKEDATTSSKWNNVPPKVMMTGVFESPENTPLHDSFWAVPGDTAGFDAPGRFIYAIFYSQALNQAEGVNEVISLDGDQSAPFNVSSDPTLRTYSTVILDIEGTVSASSPSGSGAVINAMEIYEEIPLGFSYGTGVADMNFISFLKTTFNMTYLQGDPCIPVPYDIVECTLDPDSDLSNTSSLSILTLSLANLTGSSRLQKAASLLDRDNTTLSQIESLSVTDSQIDDDTAQFLVDFLCNCTNTFHDDGHARVQDLAFSNNSLTKFPNLTCKAFSNLAFLNLSYNSISSDISSHSRVLSEMFSSGADSIDLSDNIFSGIFPSDLLFFTLDFTLDSPPGRLNLNRNNITGVLNLTSWYQILQKAVPRFNSSPDQSEESGPSGAGFDLVLDCDDSNISDTIGLYSFVGNNILDIIPNTNDFLETIDFFMKNCSSSRFNLSGVLLAGNPYCDNAESTSKRFLCRSHVNEIIYDINECLEGPNNCSVSAKCQKTQGSYECYCPSGLHGDGRTGGTGCNGSNLKVVLSVSMGGVVLVAIISSISGVAISKLRRRVLELQKFQEELSNRRVSPVIFSYSEIKDATNNFHEDYKIGSGGFGVVYKGALKNGTWVAVKKLFHLDKTQVLDDFLNEVVVVTGIKHKNLIQLRGCCIRGHERMLVYDYAENGNLEQALYGTTTSPFDLKTKTKICFGIAEGLLYLHNGLQPKVIHRDIKPANILLDHNYTAKVADFGLARHVDEELAHPNITRPAGTRGYQAPELELTDKMDVFSFGILVLEIMSGRKSIDPDQASEAIDLRIWAHELDKRSSLIELVPDCLSDNFDKDSITNFIKIAVDCTSLDPRRRPSMFEVLTKVGSVFPAERSGLVSSDSESSAFLCSLSALLDANEESSFTNPHQCSIEESSLLRGEIAMVTLQSPSQNLSPVPFQKSKLVNILSQKFGA